MRDDEMTYEDALDHFHYNVLGSYVGEKTPAFAEFPKMAVFHDTNNSE